MRIGFGFDVHRFSRARTLFIGGVTIPYHYGLKGHSDADVLLHALCDALLGALAKPDIGSYFPNTRRLNKDRASSDFVKHALHLVQHAGYVVHNIDCILILDAPRLQPYYKALRTSLAKLCCVPAGAVGMKSKTTEGMLCMSNKGIAAYCVVMLKRVRRKR